MKGNVCVHHRRNGRDRQGGRLRARFRLVSRFARTPEKGAETVIYLAASPEVHGESGGYYFDCKPLALSPAGQDDDAAERLWQASEQLVGIA